jgi:hypothetical protein
MHGISIIYAHASKFDPDEDAANVASTGSPLAEGEGVLSDPLGLTVEAKERKDHEG